MLMTSLPLPSRLCPRALPALLLGAHLGHSEILSYQLFVLSCIHHHCFFLCWDRSHQSTDGKQNLPCFPTPCLLSLLCSVLFCSRLLRPVWGLRQWRFSLMVLRPVSVACRWTAPSQLVPHDLASVCTRPWYLCVRSPRVTKTPVLLESGGLHCP